MNIAETAKRIVYDIKAYWRVPAQGDSVPYREVMFLAIGWLGMRFATLFAVNFSVGNAFTGMTMEIKNSDLLMFSYISSAIGYLVAPLNAYIIDNLNSRDGKYRVYIKLAFPSALLTLITLFLPYEKMKYTSMIITLFVAGQVQGYVQNWFSTGVSNLIYTVSPTSEERTRIMTVTSLVHNFAPSVSGLLIPILSDVLAGGDLYNINTYRKIYPIITVGGALLSMFAYYGTKDRLVIPKSRVNQIGFIDALRAVLHNRIFWVRSLDAWNDFLENTKWNLLEWIFYYGKRGSMTLYGVINTFTFSSATFAMLASPALIKKLGKKKLKIWRNIIQTIVIILLFATYKKSIAAVTVLLWIDRFCGTDEVLDRSIESDMRDYQQYISGERIDGAFGMLTSYINGAVGALTNLFLPWVYKRNGFDGSDYSVLQVYDTNGKPKENVLYSLLDKMLLIAAVGAAVDVLPWLFYNITETGQSSMMHVIKLRTAAEDIPAGVCSDSVYAEAYEAVLLADKYAGQAPLSENNDEIKEAKKCDDKILRKQNIKLAKSKKHSAVLYNQTVQTADFISRELKRFDTEFGIAQANICEMILSGGEDGFYKKTKEVLLAAHNLPFGKTKEEKDFRRETISAAKELKRSGKYIKKYYSNGIRHFNTAEYEALYLLPENTDSEKKQKHKLIKAAVKERKIYGRTMRTYLYAKRISALKNGYKNIDSLFVDYDEVKKRNEEKIRLEREAHKNAALLRQREAEQRIKAKKR